MERGFGMKIGNEMSRVIMQQIRGDEVKDVKIEGVMNELY